ncbi:MAG TPA: CehA/McbA family metallohydrolase, partial [Vicinamibacteria bacterium]|nr:CehA/McbA family metallohydrolase [Vicinamibacteria bacterium]
VHSPSYSWGRMAFASRPHRLDAPRALTDALPQGTDWGELQTAVADNAYAPGGVGTLWISALANPRPGRPLKALRLEARSADVVALCGLTLFHGQQNPLRFDRLGLYRLTLPEPAGEPGRWHLEVDLGILGRTFSPTEFSPEAWLAAPDAGLGERTRPLPDSRELYVEITASPEATLVVSDTQGGQRFEFDMAHVEPGRALEARSGGARVEVVERERVWLHGRVLDAATRRPTPARLAFRSREGRYIPPYGHRSEVNTGWFQDYGADVMVGDASFAYVDGTFQVELPVGEVYVELSKGFEYAPVRRRLAIDPAQRELTLEIPRFVDLRAKGWITADTHVHFLSPSTAVLEGQAEGLNLVSLLAAQWGDLFTNVGDLAHGPLVSRDGETTVQVSTENRQHLLGHLGLVGGHGAPVFPMSASGPGESTLGDPLWTSLGDWADRQRARSGLVVAVHFPYPNGELAADVALGKIDAVELFPYGAGFDTLRFHDWYRYLGAGYRLPAVGGTDKMGAYMPVGANRTYAYIGREELSFESWARAVRAGRTFMTTGPLLLLEADGHAPGDEVVLGQGGGQVEVRLQAHGFVPFHRVEVVWNGEVVASREDAAGTREMTLRETVRVPGPGWLAARCASRLGPTTAWGLAVQAHTSPVYFHVPTRELFSAPAVGYMLTLIDGAETWARTLATRSEPERMEQVLSHLAAARERLHQR